MQDENGLTALMLASASGKVEAVTALLKAGAKADAANQAKGTALHEAAAIAALPIVQALVGAKADVNAANDKGCDERSRANSGAVRIGRIAPPIRVVCD